MLLLPCVIDEETEIQQGLGKSHRGVTGRAEPTSQVLFSTCTVQLSEGQVPAVLQLKMRMTS